MTYFIAGALIGSGAALAAWATTKILGLLECAWARRRGEDEHLVAALHRLHERG